MTREEQTENMRQGAMIIGCFNLAFGSIAFVALLVRGDIISILASLALAFFGFVRGYYQGYFQRAREEAQ